MVILLTVVGAVRQLNFRQLEGSYGSRAVHQGGSYVQKKVEARSVLMCAIVSYLHCKLCKQLCVASVYMYIHRPVYIKRCKK